jgi:hypothetical protein
MRKKGESGSNKYNQIRRTYNNMEAILIFQIIQLNHRIESEADIS